MSALGLDSNFGVVVEVTMVALRHLIVSKPMATNITGVPALGLIFCSSAFREAVDIKCDLLSTAKPHRVVHVTEEVFG